LLETTTNLSECNVLAGVFVCTCLENHNLSSLAGTFTRCNT